MLRPPEPEKRFSGREDYWGAGGLALFVICLFILMVGTAYQHGGLSEVLSFFTVVAVVVTLLPLGFLCLEWFGYFIYHKVWPPIKSLPERYEDWRASTLEWE